MSAAVLNHVADGRKSGTAGYSDILDIVEPTHIENLPLAAHVEDLQTIEVGLANRPRHKSV